MAQTVSRTNFPSGTRNPQSKDAVSKLNWSQIKRVVQAIVVMAVLGVVLYYAVKSGMYVSELGAGSLIIVLLTFVRLVGDSN